MKVGLYFGSFNPIHIGHLIIANYIINHNDIKEVWFVVSPQNPFKNRASLLNEQHRLSLIKLAIDNDKNLKVSDVEFKLPRPSYTADTLVYISEKYKKNTFTVIMGSDSFQNITNWKNYNYILENFSTLVYLRPNFVEINLLKNCSVINAPMLDISASMIRKNIKEKKSIKFLVPDLVLQEIENKGYYSNSLENPT